MEGQTIQWANEKKTKVQIQHRKPKWHIYNQKQSKWKDRQYNDQTKKRQKYKYYTDIQSGISIIRSNLNGRTDNTMIKRKKDKSTNTTQKTKVAYL